MSKAYFDLIVFIVFSVGAILTVAGSDKTHRRAFTSGFALAFALCSYALRPQPVLSNELPPYIRARAIRTQGEEPAVLLRFRLEPSKAPVRRVEVREDLA